MNYFITDVEVLYPRINKPYRFDTVENRSVPCDVFDENASYNMQFRMNNAQAKELMLVMAQSYAEKREDKWPEKIPMPFTKEEDGMFIGKATLKAAYGKEATRKPQQVDAKNKAAGDDFLLTTGSTANIAVVLVPYMMQVGKAMDAGVSLRLRGVQVTNYVPAETVSPFEVVDGFSFEPESAEETLFADTTTAPAEGTSVVKEVAEAPVKEPKKVVKQKASAQKDEVDLTALVEDWDD